MLLLVYELNKYVQNQEQQLVGMPDTRDPNLQIRDILYYPRESMVAAALAAAQVLFTCKCLKNANVSLEKWITDFFFLPRLIKAWGLPHNAPLN